jgi:hypothetical protein
LFSSPIAARAQFDPAGSHADALSAAAKASPKLVKELAKELGSTPEQAAGAAGVIFGVAKSLLKQEDFAKIAKAVPAWTPCLLPHRRRTRWRPSINRPGLRFVVHARFHVIVVDVAVNARNGDGRRAERNGIGDGRIVEARDFKPETLLKAVPFLSGYLKKLGGADVGGLLGGVFKQGK